MILIYWQHTKTIGKIKSTLHKALDKPKTMIIFNSETMAPPEFLSSRRPQGRFFLTGGHARTGPGFGQGSGSAESPYGD
jgi:hypothetical protein